MDNYTNFILTIITLSKSLLAVQSSFTKDYYHYVKTGEVQVILSSYTQPLTADLEKNFC